MNDLHIEYESGLSFSDVVDKIPRITKENEVHNDDAIISFTLKYKEDVVGEVFYDEQTNHYCYDPKFNAELNQTVGDIVRAEYSTKGKDMESLLNHMYEGISENPDINLFKKFTEKEYFFNFGERHFPDGIDKYLKVLAYNHEEAIKIMLNSHYKDNYFESYNMKNFSEKYEINKQHCIDVFAQNDKDFILLKQNEFGYDEKTILHRDEVYDFAYKIFVENGEKGSNITEVSRVNLENGGEKEALNMLREYSDYSVEDVGENWEEVSVSNQYDIEVLDKKEPNSMDEDELIFFLNDANYKILNHNDEFKVQGSNVKFNSISELFNYLDKEAEEFLNDVDDNIRQDR